MTFGAVNADIGCVVANATKSDDDDEVEVDGATSSMSVKRVPANGAT